MIRHVVWDWNGTLLDDTELTVRSAMKGLEAIGCARELTVEMWRQVATRPERITYDMLYGEKLTEDQWRLAVGAWMEYYMRHEHEMRLNSQAEPALAQVAADGMTQSIVSLHDDSALKNCVRVLGIADSFTHVSGSEEVRTGEFMSKPRCVREQLLELGVVPGEALMIGDMIGDAEAAQEVGAHAILVPAGDTSKDRLVASGYPVADSFSEALRMAQSL